MHRAIPLLPHLDRGRPSRVLAACLTGLALLVGACADSTTPVQPAGEVLAAPSAQGEANRVVQIDYDAKDAAEYAEKWSNPYGRLSLDAGGTIAFRNDGGVTVRAVPFVIGADFSVFDHLKYIAISNQTFPVPAVGSITFAVDIEATTPGTQEGRVIHGCYGPAFSWDGIAPCAQPWSGVALQGQQAGVVLNMVDFATGQLFDWFLSEDRAFALIERLPSNVTGAGNVGLDKAYTQIIREERVAPGKKHRVEITYTRSPLGASVEFILDGRSFATVGNVGVPLDQQVPAVPYTGIYPSYGPGELLVGQINSFAIGHGLFSLLDAFPFQHPDRPDLSVSIPLSQRLFGQGAQGTWKNFRVTITPK